jgi:hypothetical protein
LEKFPLVQGSFPGEFSQNGFYGLITWVRLEILLMLKGMVKRM